MNTTSQYTNSKQQRYTIITIIARETFIYQQQYKNTWTDISHISRLIDRDRRSKAIESFCVVNNVEYEFIYKIKYSPQHPYRLNRKPFLNDEKAKKESNR